jgi:hypothetical protein
MYSHGWNVILKSSALRHSVALEQVTNVSDEPATSTLNSNLKIEVTESIETFTFYETNRYHNLEGYNLSFNRRENFRLHKEYYIVTQYRVARFPASAVYLEILVGVVLNYNWSESYSAAVVWY